MEKGRTLRRSCVSTDYCVHREHRIQVGRRVFPHPLAQADSGDCEGPEPTLMPLLPPLYDVRKCISGATRYRPEVHTEVR